MKKTSQLRNLIHGPGIGILMEAHNGLTAKLVEEAGFKGIWASSLAISASFGVRDNNELSWTQVMEILEFMSDCTSIPILLDGDTGYGNFNNVRRLVKKLEHIDAGGVCIEDKLFPKTNSFIAGEQQRLASIEEFCGRIKAGKDMQNDDDFVIVARTESFIAGWGLEEALKRARAYSEAGADAILVHSNIRTAEQVFSFMERWDRDTPVIAIPTTYSQVPLKDLEKARISVIIWANHTVRTVITAVRENLAELNKTKYLSALDKKIASIEEIFRLQRVDELKEAEKKYLPPLAPQTKAIILAASKGSNFGSLTDNKPKCMIPIWGKPILSNIVETLNEVGIKDISTVVGYKKEAVNLPNIHYFENFEYDKSGILSSLLLAEEKLTGNCIISFGDVLYERHVLRELLETEGDILLTVDCAWCQGGKKHRDIDSVIGSQAPSDKFYGSRIANLIDIGTHIPQESAHGEWIGLMKLSPKGAELLKKKLIEFKNEDEKAFKKANMVNMFKRMLKMNIPIHILYAWGHWLDIDSIEDISEAYTMRPTG